MGATSMDRRSRGAGGVFGAVLGVVAILAMTWEVGAVVTCPDGGNAVLPEGRRRAGPRGDGNLQGGRRHLHVRQREHLRHGRRCRPSSSSGMPRSPSRHARSWSRTTGISSRAGRRAWGSREPIGTRARTTLTIRLYGAEERPADRVQVRPDVRRRSGDLELQRRSDEAARRDADAPGRPGLLLQLRHHAVTEGAEAHAELLRVQGARRSRTAARCGSSASAVRCTGRATTIPPIRAGAGSGSTSR